MGVFFFFLENEKNMNGTLPDIVDGNRVDADILDHSKPFHSASIAERVSWAAKNSCELSKIEDKAYSLIGFLNVNMTMIYDKGVRYTRPTTGCE